jgi:lipoic acid synthetase
MGRPRALHDVKAVLRRLNLNTVCESARCPNIGECFSRPTATFMILGGVCTRGCGFCSVPKLCPPMPVDPLEPGNVALAAEELRLRHVVITSVTRDDLADGGSEQFALTIRAVKDRIPGISVEVLTPDFNGSAGCLGTVLDAGPDVFNHNVETVPALYRSIRPQADYRRSIEVLRRASGRGAHVKSGIMVGLGETGEEVRTVLRDLSAAGCSSVTIGQYLRPARGNVEVKEYVSPEVFDEYAGYGKEVGIGRVYSGPFVRSSYNAEMIFRNKGTDAGSALMPTTMD